MLCLLGVSCFLGMASGLAQANLDALNSNAYRPIFELVRLVNALTHLTSRPELTLSREQESAMLVVLQPLPTLESLSSTEAAQSYQALESLLTPTQQSWWLELRKAQEALVQRRSTQIRTVGKPNPYMFFIPGYGAIWRELATGNGVNPFKFEPNRATLETLMGELEAAE
jgi:hypothetical protein